MTSRDFHPYFTLAPTSLVAGKLGGGFTNLILQRNAVKSFLPATSHLKLRLQPERPIDAIRNDAIVGCLLLRSINRIRRGAPPGNSGEAESNSPTGLATVNAYNVWSIRRAGIAHTANRFVHRDDAIFEAGFLYGHFRNMANKKVVARRS